MLRISCFLKTKKINIFCRRAETKVPIWKSQKIAAKIKSLTNMRAREQKGQPMKELARVLCFKHMNRKYLNKKRSKNPERPPPKKNKSPLKIIFDRNESKLYIYICIEKAREK